MPAKRPTRTCDMPGCGESLEGMHHSRRFCSDAHRKASKRSGQIPTTPLDEPIRLTTAAKLRAEFEVLGVIDSYEADAALGLAMQLDNGRLVGPPYVSVKKELDQSVAVLRLKAPKPDSKVAQLSDAFEKKRRRSA